MDTFARCGANSGSENSNEDVTAAYDTLLEIGAAAGVELIVVIDHMSKGGDGTTARGATAKQDYPDDFTTGVFADGDDPNSARVISTRGRSSDEATSVTYEFDVATRRHRIVDVGDHTSPARAAEDIKRQRMEDEVLGIVDGRSMSKLPPLTKTDLNTNC